MITFKEFWSMHNVQIETGDKWYSSEVSIGVNAINIFVADMDSGIECMPSNFVNSTKL